jgi:hypothetical protein
MRIFTVIAAAAALALSVAVSFAHEPPEWTSDVTDGGGPPAWVDDVKTEGGPPAFVETAGGTSHNKVIDEDAARDENATERALGENNANVPEWVADVKANGGPPEWVEVVKAEGGPPAWVAEVRTIPAAATAAAQKKAGR